MKFDDQEEVFFLFKEQFQTVAFKRKRWEVWLDHSNGFSGDDGVATNLRVLGDQNIQVICHYVNHNK